MDLVTPDLGYDFIDLNARVTLEIQNYYLG